ncbi:MAG TPA: R3H domain-containing nucleic acid-binding protein [Acidimicrobiales bacterium]|nr:R3H domain-containing nucleic acid-binding protein [Acidimicrobiales bacterium]
MGDVPGEGFGAVVDTEDGLSDVADLEPDDEDLEDEFEDDDDLDDLDDDADSEDVVSEDIEGEADDDEGDDEDDEDEDDEEDGGPVDEDELNLLEQEGEIAADYIEGLLDIADLDGDIDMDVEGDRAVVSVVGATLDELVGDDGEVLEALQELTRLAVHRQTGVRARLMLDVGGFRARRRSELAELGRSVADEVARTGEPKKLAPMSPFERKIIHDAVAVAGLRSESEGEEPHRRVVVFPVG